MYEYSRRFGRWIVLDERNARKRNTSEMLIFSGHFPPKPLWIVINWQKKNVKQLPLLDQHSLKFNVFTLNNDSNWQILCTLIIYVCINKHSWKGRLIISFKHFPLFYSTFLFDKLFRLLIRANDCFPIWLYLYHWLPETWSSDWKSVPLQHYNLSCVYAIHCMGQFDACQRHIVEFNVRV